MQPHPMVGGGFRQGRYGAATLSGGVDEGQAFAVHDLLDSHDRQRLALAQDHVERNQDLT